VTPGAFETSEYNKRDPFGRLPNPRLLRTYDRTKEISFHPYFRGGISRWFWRMFMYRVTQPGRWFLGLTFFLVLYGTTSLDIQTFVPLLYVFGICLVAWLICILYPPKVKVTSFIPERVAAGAYIPIKFSVTSRSRSPWVEIVVIPMRLHPMVDSVPPSGIAFQQLNPGQTIVLSSGLFFHKRGIYELKGFRVESSFPLGLLRAYSAHWHATRVLAYPTFHPLSDISLPTGMRYQPGGVALASKLGDSTEYIGNREYRDGDNVRDIDWKATARLTVPVVREYREEYFYRVGVIQDTYLSTERADRDADFERAVSICAAVSDYLAREEYVVDLFAAGPDLYHLTAGRSLAFQDQILDILACLEPAKTEPFEIIKPELLECLGQLTTVVCVMLDWDEVRRDFVENIRQVSAVKVIVVRSRPCTLDPSFASDSLSLKVVGHDDFENGISSL
jgi:uncharacterized protein (DUF58 family)